MDLKVNNSDQCPGETEDIIFWSLNCYGVTVPILIINFVTILVGFFITFLNSVVVGAVLSRSNSEDVTDILIASLAVADAVNGVFVIYHTSYNVGNWQVFEECMFRYGILLASNLSSVLHMAFLTIDCYIKITRPYLYHRIMKKARVIVVSVIVWMLALLWGYLPIMGWNPGQSSDPKTPACGFFIITLPNYRLIMCFLYFIPMLKNIIVYSHIFRIAKKHALSIGQQTGSCLSKKSLKFTKTVVLVIGFYFFCYSPAGVFLMIEYAGSLDYLNQSQKGTLMIYVIILGYVNSLLNPIIYAVKIPYIKRRFGRIFGKVHCCLCFRRVSPGEASATDWPEGSMTAAPRQTEVTQYKHRDIHSPEL